MKTYKMREAIDKLRAHGLTVDVSNKEHARFNRLVTIEQDWLPDGTEIGRFRLARGRYRGCFAGFMARPKH